jgi:Fe-S-cluster containining protein
VSKDRVLRKHTLKHIPVLKVQDELLNFRFRAGCAMSNCEGMCCGGGADADVAERDRILEHADLVRSHMDADQQRDLGLWFDEPVPDRDFPSGLAATTQMHNDRCVFLNSAGRCVLQIVEPKLKDGGFLKPFFCRAFPICINNGELSVDRQFECETACCGGVANGSLDVFDVCVFELDFVLGAEGAAELRELREPHTSANLSLEK